MTCGRSSDHRDQRPTASRAARWRSCRAGRCLGVGHRVVVTEGVQRRVRWRRHWRPNSAICAPRRGCPRTSGRPPLRMSPASPPVQHTSTQRMPRVVLATCRALDARRRDAACTASRHNGLPAWSGGGSHASILWPVASSGFEAGRQSRRSPRKVSTAPRSLTLRLGLRHVVFGTLERPDLDRPMSRMRRLRSRCTRSGCRRGLRELADASIRFRTGSSTSGRRLTTGRSSRLLGRTVHGEPGTPSGAAVDRRRSVRRRAINAASALSRRRTSPRRRGLDD